ncbi:MAG: 6,7-dimethyl-8-ribityllumazine synthase [Chitinophagaceae bacterium]
MSTPSEHGTLLNINNLQVPDSQVVVVYTEWNDAIILELLKGAQQIFSLFPSITVKTFKVPGAVEIPFALRQAALHLKPQAMIAFGCVIRGETPHFDYVCQSVTEGITRLNTEIDIPSIFGVLTVNNEQQAYDRLGGMHGHKGQEAAIAALKMIHFNSLLHS